jgi:hypothetical protein
VVAVLRRPGELLGWSAFRAPYRYTASVRCEEPSELIRVRWHASGQVTSSLPGPPDSARSSALGERGVQIRSGP